MIIKKLAKRGTGRYVLLDKAFRDLLNIKEHVQITIENDKIIIQAIENENIENK
jgi:hypothetical protein